MGLLLHADASLGAPTLDDLKSAKLIEVSQAADQAGQVSFPFDFGQAPAVNDDGSPAGDAGVKHLQMRNTSDNPDQSNWGKLMPIALAAVVSQSTDPIPLRVEENVSVMASAQQVVQALTGAFARGSQIVIGILPSLKLRIASATTAEDVAKVAWPAQ